MQVDHSPSQPLGKPCLRDMATLVSPTGLLPAALVPLMSDERLSSRANEIGVTHPQYREELPVLVAYEMKRRRRLSGELEVAVNQFQVA